MANDKDWQRRSDEWVKAMHESRLRKAGRLKRQEKSNEKQNSLLKKPETTPNNLLQERMSLSEKKQLCEYSRKEFRRY